jgi:hypothetical protein
MCSKMNGIGGHHAIEITRCCELRLSTAYQAPKDFDSWRESSFICSLRGGAPAFSRVASAWAALTPPGLGWRLLVGLML